MCSILGILEIRADAQGLRDQALELSRRQRHRGPDWSGVFACDRAILAHERLSIVDVLHGAQPLGDLEKGPVLAVNGEIYNHRQLRERFPDHAFATDSDCEVILPLYVEKGTDFLNDLNGIFAFVLYDVVADRYIVARDPMGVIPLYTGRDEHGNLYVASEMKALTPVCRSVAVFPPGHVLDSEVGPEPVRYYDPAWRSPDALASEGIGAAEVRKALQEAVHRQLMSDVPYGVLLSGGLDSSIVSAVAKRYAARRIEDDDYTEAWWPQLHSFAIGLADAPDLVAAAQVATHIGTVHHEFHFTVQEGIDALRDVIYHLETYDVTTIRASTPMYLMARRIRAMGIKMVLSGEGADEIFGGYLYFHKAPNAREFHEETVRKLDRLHSFDCLRANKSMAAWGIEARVPFLDLDFLETAMNMDPAAKMVGADGMEKRILRDAFADHLPEVVLKRQKEQFSDGVGYSWIDSLKAHAASRVTDRDMDNARFRFPYNTPDTKEGYFYRSIFEEHFPLASAVETVPGGKSVACSTPEALAWDASFHAMNEPSGRAIKGVHKDAY
ncbi:MAG TPA: asparagine synthase B [Longimicrobiales bacterium]|nr:asparagine synthase B [Longimicrobiales bacterium]